MGFTRNKQRLREIFAALGAESPELSADAQSINPNEIFRFLFLSQAWRRVSPVDDTSWVEDEIQRSRENPGLPFSGLGPALERLLKSGASVADIAELVRCKEVQLLHSICYLLEDPGFDDVPDEIEELSWGLFPIVNDSPKKVQITGLHESLLGLDPTRREMRRKEV